MVKAVYLELVSALTTEIFLLFERVYCMPWQTILLWIDIAPILLGINENCWWILQPMKDSRSYLRLRTAYSGNSFQSVHHFGGLWEAAVKKNKELYHFMHVIEEAFEELTTALLTQIKACLNSCPSTPQPSGNEDWVKALTQKALWCTCECPRFYTEPCPCYVCLAMKKRQSKNCTFEHSLTLILQTVAMSNIYFLQAELWDQVYKGGITMHAVSSLHCYNVCIVVYIEEMLFLSYNHTISIWSVVENTVACLNYTDFCVGDRKTHVNRSS